MRLAWRDLRREPRRGALVVALVSVPAAALMAVGTIQASQTPTVDELVRSQLGANQAWVATFGGGPLHQSPTEPRATWSDDSSGSSIDGASPAVDVTTLLPPGARTLLLAQTVTVVSTDAAAARMKAVVGEPWDPAFAGMYDVKEGRAPTGPGEMMLSPAAMKKLGVGLGDQVTLLDGSPAVTVVGVLMPRIDQLDGEAYALPADLSASNASNSTWYLPDTVLTWDDILALNQHGVIAYSRSVAHDPPHVNYPMSSNDPATIELISIAGIGMFAVVLLAGAAFSVGFRRDRRRLALLAATGAGRGSIVSVGAASGAWLGLMGGVVGSAVGLPAGLGWVMFLLRWGGPEGQYSTWGYHVVWWHPLAVMAFSAFMGAGAALVPAAATSRFDVMSALRGSRAPTRPRPRIAWMGLGIFVLGLALWAVAVMRYNTAFDLPRDSAYPVAQQATILKAAGYIACFVGAVLAVPMALHALARLVAPWGVAPRIAARDAARNAGRTVPVVAAIAITMAIATGALIAANADVRSMSQPQPHEAPPGDGVAVLSSSPNPADAEAAQAASDAILSVLPGATVTIVDTWPDNLPPDVEWTQSLRVPNDRLCPAWADSSTTMTPRQMASDPRCGADSVPWGNNIFSVAVGGKDQLRALLGTEPSAEDLAVLAEGGIVAFDGSAVVDGKIEVAQWHYGAGNYPDGQTQPERTEWLPAVVHAPAYLYSHDVAAIMSPETSARLGAVAAPARLYVHGQAPLTTQDELAVNGALVREGNVWFTVAQDLPMRGPYNEAFILGLASLLVAGVSTGVALGLARAEAKRDDFTLSSVGASPRLAKRVSAWQAAIIVGFATGIGVFVATGFEWVGAHEHGAGGGGSNAFGPPWLWLAAAIVVVPALVTGLAWVFTRAPKAMHYRLAA